MSASETTPLGASTGEKYESPSQDQQGVDPEKGRDADIECPKEITLCCQSIVTTILNGLLLFLSGIAHLVIGIKYRHDCPVQDWIPIYLTVVGVGILALFVVNCIWNFYLAKRGDLVTTSVLCNWLILVRYGFLGCMFFFAQAWFIGGSVLVYSVYKKISIDPMSPNYCHLTVYQFSFTTLTITWLMVALLFIVALFGCCVASYKVADIEAKIENMLPWGRKLKRHTANDNKAISE